MAKSSEEEYPGTITPDMLAALERDRQDPTFYKRHMQELSDDECTLYGWLQLRTLELWDDPRDRARGIRLSLEILELREKSEGAEAMHEMLDDEFLGRPLEELARETEDEKVYCDDQWPEAAA